MLARSAIGGLRDHPVCLPQANAQVVSIATGASFNCALNGCAFARPRTAVDPDPSIVPKPPSRAVCLENYPTRIRRATVQDRTGRTGPLVLPGPFCKKRTNASSIAQSWDVPPSAQIDATTFLMTAGSAEAVQLDGPGGLAAGGWILATGLDRLVDGTSTGSVLPLDQLSVEV